MITYLNRLVEDRDALTAKATALTDKAAAEDRYLTDAEQVELRSWQEQCEDIDRQLAEHGHQAESQRAYARLRPALDNAKPEPQRRDAQVSVPQGWGERFVTSDAFRNYLGRGASAQIEVPSPLETRAAIDIGTWPGTLPPYVYTPPSFTASTPLLDVVGKVTTGSNSVEWIKWTPNPQTAAPVVPEGGLKPEADMTATPFTDTLETYAHWKAITRQALEDIPQIRSIVEGRLRQGITTALEGAVTAALLADVTIPAVTGVDLLAAIRGGIGTVQANGFASANAVLLNPVDWAELDFVVMGETNQGPTLAQSFWGLRPIAVPSVPVGTAYVGDFQAAVTLFTRGTTALYMTDSHADYFVRNLILLLAEQRAVATVPEPLAAAKCTVGVATASSRSK